MRRLRSVACAIVFTVGVGIEAVGAETFDDEQVPFETGSESTPVVTYESECSAAGGVVESRPSLERNGTSFFCVRTYTVRRGDWLWKVARATLRERNVRPTPTAVKREAARIYETNRATIGPNPNRLLAGQKLRILALGGRGYRTFPGVVTP